MRIYVANIHIMVTRGDACAVVKRKVKQFSFWLFSPRERSISGSISIHLPLHNDTVTLPHSCTPRKHPAMPNHDSTLPQTHGHNIASKVIKSITSIKIVGTPTKTADDQQAQWPLPQNHRNTSATAPHTPCLKHSTDHDETQKKAPPKTVV